MAFVPFYLDPAATGANDLNSGSTVATPTHTYGGGTFVRATGVYTVASGTPNTDGYVAAGDYVSIYTTSGRTVATFVSKVLSTGATTITVDVATIFYGLATTVSEAANASTLTIGGSWATPLPLGATLTAGGLGTFTVPQSTKINIKGAQTIAASPTISMAGATTTPLWFSGYNTTPGDLDNDTTNSLAKPVWTLSSTVGVTTTGAYQLWSGLSVTGVRASAIFTVNSTTFIAVRCRIENTSSNASAGAVLIQQTNAYFLACWFKTPTTATGAGIVVANTTTRFAGCVFDTGGVAGLNAQGGGSYMCLDCIFLNNVGAGVTFTTGSGYFLRCSFVATTVDGIKWTGTPGQVSTVLGCVFAGPNGGTAMTNGLNNASGTNTDNVYRACNDYYNVTNPEVGFGDSPAFFGQTDSAYPLASATDLTPLSTSNARIHGFPGVFENETFQGFADIGAVQRKDGVLVNPGLSGGLR